MISNAATAILARVAIRPPHGAEIVRRQDRIDAAERKKRRQRQTAEYAADDEEQQRDQHAPRSAANRIERPRAAAVRQLHAGTEDKRADDQRGPERSDGAAVFRQQRRYRHHDDRADRDHDQAAEKPPCLTACQESPPRGGVTELGLEECNSETEADQ